MKTTRIVGGIYSLGFIKQFEDQLSSLRAISYIGHIN